MAEGLRSFWIVLIITVLFVFCLMEFTYNFVSLNNSNSSLLTTGIGSSVFGQNGTFNQINNSLSGLQSSTQSISYAAYTSQPDPVFIFLILRAVLTAPFALIQIAIGSISTVFIFIFIVLFDSSYLAVAGTVSAIVAVSFLIWWLRFVRIGQD